MTGINETLKNCARAALKQICNLLCGPKRPPLKQVAGVGFQAQKENKDQE
jgi:hypothetical protein